MVVKHLKQFSNIQQTYNNLVFRKYQKSKNHVFGKSLFFSFEENHKNRFVSLFGISIFLDFWFFHIFHCLGSHARGHLGLEHPEHDVRTPGTCCSSTLNILFKHPEHLVRTPNPALRRGVLRHVAGCSNNMFQVFDQHVPCVRVTCYI